MIKLEIFLAEEDKDQSFVTFVSMTRRRIRPLGEDRSRNSVPR